jgi:actin-related protein
VKESLGRNQEEYELPNGTKLNVSRVKNHIEHALFDEGKLHEKMHRYIECSDEFQRSLLYYNVIFSGGNTFLYFFEKEPMLNRLSTVTNTNTLLCRTNRGNIVLPPERKFSVWIGGSILGSLSTFQYGNELNFSKDEYNEKGIERFALHNYMLDDLQ